MFQPVMTRIHKSTKQTGDAMVDHHLNKLRKIEREMVKIHMDASMIQALDENRLEAIRKVQKLENVWKLHKRAIEDEGGTNFRVCYDTRDILEQWVR